VPLFLYGVIVYIIFLISFLYAIGFVGNFLVPKSIDSGAPAELVPAVIVNLLLLGLFAVQHSVMARPAFKRWWTQYIPPAVERSTYVLLTSLILLLLYWLWQPLPGVIWSVEKTIGVYILWSLFALGWLIVLLSTFLIDHFDLFGLRQVWLHLRGREYTPPEFRVRMLYRYVRHARFHNRLLGNAAHEYRPLAVRHCHHCLYPHRRGTGGTRSDQGPR